MLWETRAQFKALLTYATDKGKYDMSKLQW